MTIKNKVTLYAFILITIAVIHLFHKIYIDENIIYLFSTDNNAHWIIIEQPYDIGIHSYSNKTTYFTKNIHPKQLLHHIDFSFTSIRVRLSISY